MTEEEMARAMVAVMEDRYEVGDFRYVNQTYWRVEAVDAWGRVTLWNAGDGRTIAEVIDPRPSHYRHGDWGTLRARDWDPNKGWPGRQTR